MIHLEKITWENYSICAVGLELDEKQQTFLASNEQSLVEAYVSLLNDRYPWLPFAIYLDNIIIGFTMIYYKPENNELSKESCYAICRFMIAKNYQGKGYGKTAIKEVIEKIKTFPYGQAPAIFLSYKNDNINARNLFLSVGFIETGEKDSDGDTLAKLIIS